MINLDFRINYYPIIVIFLKFRINSKIAEIYLLLFDLNSHWLFQKRRTKN